MKENKKRENARNNIDSASYNDNSTINTSTE